MNATETRPARAQVRGTSQRDHRGSWLPTWGLISTKHLELRRRHGQMVVVALLTVGLPFVVLGIRLLFHAVDPSSYGPAGSPSVFSALCNPMAEFGFIAGAALGATAGTTDLTDGVFRQLVITGRSRLALYLARIPAGLVILLPLMALAFASVCLVTAYAGTPQPISLSVNGVSIPLHLDKAQLETWIVDHPERAEEAFASISTGKRAPVVVTPGHVQPVITRHLDTIYRDYLLDQPGEQNPAPNEMAKIGLWIELDVGIGFMVGLGLGSLMGERTVPTVILIALEIIVTPILADVTIPYFVNGQRLLVGVAMDQLRPAALASGTGGGHGRVLFGGKALGIPPMPTWAMIAVIVGWIVGWTIIGAWKMRTRDA